MASIGGFIDSMSGNLPNRLTERDAEAIRQFYRLEGILKPLKAEGSLQNVEWSIRDKKDCVVTYTITDGNEETFTIPITGKIAYKVCRKGG